MGFGIRDVDVNVIVVVVVIFYARNYRQFLFSSMNYLSFISLYSLVPSFLQPLLPLNPREKLQCNAFESTLSIFTPLTYLQLTSSRYYQLASSYSDFWEVLGVII